MVPSPQPRPEVSRFLEGHEISVPVWHCAAWKLRDVKEFSNPQSREHLMEVPKSKLLQELDALEVQSESLAKPQWKSHGAVLTGPPCASVPCAGPPVVRPQL